MDRSFFVAMCSSSLLVAAAPKAPTAPAVVDNPIMTSSKQNSPYLGVDFIYWTAKQEGNNYASTGTAITVPGTVDPNTGLTPGAITGQGSVYAPKPQAKPGFKVALGITLHQAWDLSATYTWLQGTEKSAVASTNLNAGILPLFAYLPNNSILADATCFSASGATGFVSQAAASWRLQFNNVNVELGKSIPFGSFLLHPHLGLQGSWQKQNFQASYTVSSTTDSSTFLGKNTAQYNQTFWGIGPRVGIDGLWQLCEHLGLFGDTAVSLLWGQAKGISKSYDTNTLSSYTSTLIANQKNNPSLLSPVAELILGFSSDWLSTNNYRFVANIAWNAQVWFFQNQHSASIPNSSLILQGLNIGLRWDF